MKLTKAQKKLLRALINGATLKSHRSLEGAKSYQLHPLDGPAKMVRWTAVEALKNHGLIDSNKKFPAATYLLTEKGQQIAATLAESANRPLSAKNY